MAEPTLFDEASLALIASGGAGKDGKVYSVKPVPVYGPELVTNGDFATDSDWNKGGGWTISGGTANCTGTGTSILRQTNAVPFNTKFYVSLEVKNYVSGTLQVKFAPTLQNLNVTGNGIYTVLTTGDNNINQDIQIISPNFVGSVDNVSAKKVLASDGDFTFSRGSNLSATRVNSSQLIEKGRENIVKYSNDFSNWTNYLTNETSGQADRSGGNTAWLLEKTGGGGSIYRTHSTSGVNTFSAYVKAGTLNWVRMDFTGGGSKGYFDLQNGVVGSVTGSPIDTAIEDAGNGWYRCSITTTSVGSGSGISPAENDGSVGGTSGNLYIQDAQLETSLVATPYIETGATSAQAGILENTPRFDYSGGATCPSLLLEPSRANLVPISEGVPEGTNNVTLTENYATSPEGVQNSLKVQKNGVDSNDRIQPIGNYNATLVSGKDYTISCFVKNIDATNAVTTLGCRVSGGSLFRSGYEWDGSSLSYLTTGYNSGIRENIFVEDYENDWWRIGFTFEADGTSANFELDIDRRNGSGSNTTSIETWGWQLESATGDASYATSYIPTYGVSQTRAGEACGDAGDAATFNSTEGVLYAEIAALAEESDSKRITISDGTLANRITISVSDNIVSGFINVNNVTQYTFYESGQNVLSTIKIAVKYKANDFALWINGTEYDVSSSGSTFANDTLNLLSFDNATFANYFYGKTKQVLVFKEALSDTELIKLTTI